MRSPYGWHHSDSVHRPKRLLGHAPIATLTRVADFIDDFDRLVAQDRLGSQINAGCDALDANDLDRAIRLLTAPADAGIGIAMFNLAVAFNRKGYISKAITWYERAAESGDLDAMAYLGYAYKLLGDSDEALKWYSKAASHGHAHAQVESGKILDPLDNSSVAAATAKHTASLMAQGAVANNDLDQAVTYWTLAAEAGDAESMVKIAVAAEVRRHYGEAVLWYAAAERAGVDKVTARLDELAPYVRNYARSAAPQSPPKERPTPE